MTRIIALANQKGGVGKTTTAVNVAAVLAEADQRVLLLDLDPQCNASSGLGVRAADRTHSTYGLLAGEASFAEVTSPTLLEGLFLIPSSPDLAAADIELAGAKGREHLLARVLKSVDPAYDFVFIDCPPSLGLLTLNALVAAPEVLIPIQCEYYALEGVSQLMNNIEMVRAHLNPRLTVSTVILTMYDGRTKLADQVSSEVRRYFGDKVLRTVIPRSVKVSEAPGYSMTIIDYDPGSRGAMSYLDASRELATRDTSASVEAQS